MVGTMGCAGVEAIRGLRPVAGVTKGVRPDIGVKVESPAVDIEIGVNMARFVPCIMDMLGTVPIPRTHKDKRLKWYKSQNACMETMGQTYFRLIVSSSASNTHSSFSC